MDTIIRATDPAGLLGAIPALAGFTPRRSVVLLPFRGASTRGAMRIDLPEPHQDPEQFAAAALRTLLQVSGLDATAIVVYTDELARTVPDGVLLPHLPVAEALIDVCAHAGLPLVDVLCVTPDGWSDYLDDEPAIRPLDSIPATPEVPGLGDVSGDQAAGSDLPRGDLADRERVGRALIEIEEVMERRRQGRPSATAEENPIALMRSGVLLDDLPAFAEELIDPPSDQDPYSCAALLWCLNRPALRDAILVQWARDVEFGCRALSAQLLHASDGAGVPDDIGDVFLGRGPRPDPDRLGCALEVVRRAAGRAPRSAKAAALTAAAWLAWALGRSTHAGRYVDEALRIDPDLSMAALISTMLAAAMLPEWTLHRT